MVESTEKSVNESTGDVAEVQNADASKIEEARKTPRNSIYREKFFYTHTVCKF